MAGTHAIIKVEQTVHIQVRGSFATTKWATTNIRNIESNGTLCVTLRLRSWPFGRQQPD